MLNVFKNKFSQIHKQSKEAKELLRFIGPGILVTVGFIDPGNWAANLAAGADYGYALLWVVHIDRKRHNIDFCKIKVLICSDV